MATFQHIQPGQKLPTKASTWNAMLDAAREHAYRVPGQGRRGGGGHDTNIVLVKNESGEDQDRFAVLGIDAPIILPEDNEKQFKAHVALRGVLPDVAEHRGRFVVLQAPLKAGAIGRAIIAGVTVARVHLADASVEQYADIEADESGHLVATPSGSARILWSEDGESAGVRWAIVRLGDAGATGFWARLTGTDAEDASTHTFVEVDGAGEDVEDGRSGNAAEANGREGISTDTIVFVQQVGFDEQEGKPTYRFEKDQGNSDGSAADLAESSDGGVSSAPSARSAEWDRADQGEDRGVETSRLTRAYLERSLQEGDEHLPRLLTLYGENELHEADGHLQEVRDENKVLDELEVWPPVVGLNSEDKPGFLEDKLHTDDSDPATGSDPAWITREIKGDAGNQYMLIGHKEPQEADPEREHHIITDLHREDFQFLPVAGVSITAYGVSEYHAGSPAQYDANGHFIGVQPTTLWNIRVPQLLWHLADVPVYPQEEDTRYYLELQDGGLSWQEVDDGEGGSGGDPPEGVEVDLLSKAEYNGTTKHVEVTPRKVKVLEDLGDQAVQTVLTPANLAEMLKELPGYDAGAHQTLDNVNGSIMWVSYEDCDD